MNIQVRQVNSSPHHVHQVELLNLNSTVLPLVSALSLVHRNHTRQKSASSIVNSSSKVGFNHDFEEIDYPHSCISRVGLGLSQPPTFDFVA